MNENRKGDKNPTRHGADPEHNAVHGSPQLYQDAAELYANAPIDADDSQFYPEAEPGPWRQNQIFDATTRRYSGQEWPSEDFSGRGPKGYKRLDDRILEDINEALTQSSHVDASQIEVKVEQGEVTLNGFVSTREMKRRAERECERVLGVHDIHNRLRIRQEPPGESLASDLH